MKTITTYYGLDHYSVTADNRTTLERIEFTFSTPVPLKVAVSIAKKYMKLLDHGGDIISAVVTSASTGEVLAEIEKRV